MGLSTGELVEIYLQNGQTGGRIRCAPNVIPSPGQYLLAHDPASDAPLPGPVFSAGSVPGGFLVAPPIPPAWRPGTTLSVRGPLGRGFSLPANACCVALVALGGTSARLDPLMAVALEQGGAVVLVGDLEMAGLPPEVEIRPVAALPDVASWADYIAFDLPRQSLPGLREKLGFGEQAPLRFAAQALIHTPMPCGGMAECGVCAVTTRRGVRLACKDGPVFDLAELF